MNNNIVGFTHQANLNLPIGEGAIAGTRSYSQPLKFVSHCCRASIRTKGCPDWKDNGYPDQCDMCGRPCDRATDTLTVSGSTDQHEKILSILENLRPHSPDWVQELWEYIGMLVNQNLKLKQTLVSARLVMAERKKNDEAVDAIDTVLDSMNIK